MITSTLFQAWQHSPWLPIPAALMALAATGWLRGRTRALSESDALELTTACAMLNAVALVYWCVSREDTRALIDWAVHAAVLGAAVLLIGLFRAPDGRRRLARVAPAVGYLGVALLLTLGLSH